MRFWAAPSFNDATLDLEHDREVETGVDSDDRQVGWLGRQWQAATRRAQMHESLAKSKGPGLSAYLASPTNRMILALLILTPVGLVSLALSDDEVEQKAPSKAGALEAETIPTANEVLYPPRPAPPELEPNLETLEAMLEDPAPDASPRKRKRKNRRKQDTTSITKQDSPTGAVPDAKTPPAPKENAHCALGRTLMKQRKVKVAIGELKSCVAAEPQNASAYKSLGLMYSMLKQEAEAVQYFEKFLSIGTGHKDAAKVKKIVSDYYARHPR
jgi:tetratricopeptide (TPR) repeat protein